MPLAPRRLGWPWLGVGTHWVDLAALPHQGRTLLRLSGPDAPRFLQGTLSADIEGLSAGECRPAALLTVKGKLVSDAILVPLADGVFGLAVPTELAEGVAALLDRHIIMDDVTVAVDADIGIAFAWGEGVESVAGAEVAVFRASYPAPGRVIVGKAGALKAALETSTKVSPEAWAAYRIETASPAWGHELAPDHFPPEVGFVSAVSYDKGCFMGQEPLARIHARGQVNWVLVRIESDGEMGEGAKLSHPERPEAGRLTSVATSDGRRVGLAIVRRAYAEPGVELATDVGVAVRVVSGPLGDDPGQGARVTGAGAALS